MPAAVARSDVGSGVSANHKGGGEGLITENKIVSDVGCWGPERDNEVLVFICFVF